MADDRRFRLDADGRRVDQHEKGVRPTSANAAVISYSVSARRDISNAIRRFAVTDRDLGTVPRTKIVN